MQTSSAAAEDTDLLLLFEPDRFYSFVERLEEYMPTSTDLLQGTLDMLILKTLAHGSQHGWGIASRIQQISQEILQIGQGSLYPALHRLEYKGWIEASWGISDNNRRAKFYTLTLAGRKQLRTEIEQWQRLSAAITVVLGAAKEQFA